MVLDFIGNKDIRKYRLVAFAAAVFFTAVMALMLVELQRSERDQLIALAKTEAVSNVNKDLAYRMWATHLGGIYVAVTENTQPSPYLTHIPDQNVVTPSGKQLTLVNPAWMIRMIMENYSSMYGITGRVTSLKQMNPGNAPDDWERTALERFDRGESEIYEQVEVGGQPYMRYIRAFKTEEGCLKCHGHQGYKVGDVRGGISVVIPMESYVNHFKAEHLDNTISILVVWLIGLLGIGAAYRLAANRLRDRDEFELELLERENRYHSLFEQSNDAIMIVDTRGKIVEVNSKSCELLGASRSELLGMRNLDLHPDSEKGNFVKAVEEFRENGKSRFETKYVKADGSLIDVEISSAYVGESKSLIQGIVRDISERKRYQEALERDAKLYATLMDAFPGAAMLIERNTMNIIVSNKAAQLRGAGPGTKCFIYSSRDGKCTQCRAEDAFKAHSPIVAECDDRERIIEAHWIPISDDTYMHYMFDVTEKKRMEEEMVKHQRLESLALFAGGIAHDFNNIMSTIWGNIQLAARSLDDKEELTELLGDSEQACARARTLTLRLLTIAKGGTPDMKKVSLEGPLSDNVRFMTRGANVKCEVDIARDLKSVNADLGQIEQVIQNLVVNAVQAMPEGGKITVRAYNIDVHADDKAPVPPGMYVMVTVIDEGRGISPDNLVRIFEPYFTTKKTGSGLGLATCYSIVKKHAGALTVESEPGKGSTFRFYLPAVD